MAASYEARAYGIHGGMGGRPGAAALSPRRRGPATLLRLHGGEQGAVRPVRGDRAARRGALAGGGVPGRARAWSGSRGPRARSPSGCGAGRGSESGWRSPSASPGRRCSPRWRAAPPSPTACSSSSPIGRRRSCGRLPVEALWGVGLVTADKLRAHGIRTIGELERRDEGELALFLGAHAARHLHAIAHRPRPAPGAPRAAAPLDRHPVGVRRRRKVRVGPRRAAGHPGRQGHAAGAGGQPCGPHRDASLSLRRLLPRHALADARPPDRGHRRDPGGGAGAARRGQAA